jgi:hypothetical protein
MFVGSAIKEGAMRTRYLGPFHISNIIAWIVVIGGLALNHLTGSAPVSADHLRNDLIQAQDAIRPLVIEGEVMRVQGEFVGKNFSHMKDRRYIVETPVEGTWALSIGENTRVIGNIVLGDYVHARVGRDGTLQSVQKIVHNQTNAPHIPGGRLLPDAVESEAHEDVLFVTQNEPAGPLPFAINHTLPGPLGKGAGLFPTWEKKDMP